MNEPLLLYPDHSNSTQVWVKLFHISEFHLRLLEFAQMFPIFSQF